ncbi:MAG: hypothetical protein SFX73_15075 [Kofleriaceae bacterium]|nr:hypothetical protein [Kofleriaceae bacterium]
MRMVRRTSRTTVSTERLPLVVVAAVAACGGTSSIEIVPGQIETVTMRASNRKDGLAHQVSVVVPKHYKHERDELSSQRWGAPRVPSLTIDYGYTNRDEAIRAQFEHARKPCRELSGLPQVEMRREVLPDGFQVMCGFENETTARPNEVLRFIRVDDALLLCNMMGMDRLSDSEVKAVWMACASVVVQIPHMIVPPPRFGPRERWSMELVKFDDGWTGWKTLRHQLPETD